MRKRESCLPFNIWRELAQYVKGRSGFVTWSDSVFKVFKDMDGYPVRLYVVEEPPQFWAKRAKRRLKPHDVGFKMILDAWAKKANDVFTTSREAFEFFEKLVELEK